MLRKPVPPTPVHIVVYILDHILFLKHFLRPEFPYHQSYFGHFSILAFPPPPPRPTDQQEGDDHTRGGEGGTHDHILKSIYMSEMKHRF